MSQLPRARRRETILDAARDLLDEADFNDISMPEIAARVGVSRQIVYLHFHSVDEVLDSLYDRTFREYFDELESIDVTQQDTTASGLARLQRLLELPPPIHRVIYSAFFAGPKSRSALTTVQRRITEWLDDNWIQPLTSHGMNVEIATSGLYAAVSATLQFRELVDRGVISQSTARLQLARLTESLFTNPTEAVAANP